MVGPVAMVDHEVVRTVDGEEQLERSDVEGWWTDAVEGRCSVREAALWAEQECRESRFADLTVREGVLTLQSFVHVSRTGVPAEQSRADLAKALAHWRGIVAAYDADTSAWLRAWHLPMLYDMAVRSGRERARTFGMKIVGWGHLREEDLDVVLDPRPRQDPR